MGGSTTPQTLPGYNTGTAPATGAPPQQGQGALSGSVYTPKFGMPTYIGGYLPQSDVNFINQVPRVAGGTDTMEGYIDAFLPSMLNPQMTSPTGYDPSMTTAYGQGISQVGASMLPYVEQSLQGGFDPQNALYARTAQLLTDQIRAAEAAQGVAGTPYGAGIEGQTMADFNMEWVNQELQREAQAASTAMQLMGTGMGAIEGGQQLAQAGPSFQTSMLSSLLGNTTTALNPQQVALSDYLSYMGQNQQAQLEASQQNIAGVSTLLDFIAATSEGGGGGGGGGGKPGGGGGGSPMSMMGGKGGGK